MDITKRSGAVEPYDGTKIMNAMAKAFGDQDKEASQEELRELLTLVEQKMEARGATSVEAIQDQVEESLMEKGYFAEARSYILYRHNRHELRVARRTIVDAVEGHGVNVFQYDMLLYHFKSAKVQKKVES